MKGARVHHGGGSSPAAMEWRDRFIGPRGGEYMNSLPVSPGGQKASWIALLQLPLGLVNTIFVSR